MTAELKEKNWNDYEKPAVTADIVIFTVENNDLKVLLIKRAIEPFKEKWAIPGGFSKNNESLDQTAIRKLEDETGVKDVYLEQLYTFSDPKRDPRGWVITTAYMALVNYEKINSEKLVVKNTNDVSEVKWFPVSKLPGLAFDHKKIIEYSIKRLRWKFEYTTVAFSLLPDKFTISEVQKMYEIAFAKEFDKRNFNKKLLSLEILKEEGLKTDVAYRPPMLYSLKKDIGEIIEII